MNSVKHLFERSRQRVTQEVKAGGDSQWQPRFLSEVWTLGKFGCWLQNRLDSRQKAESENDK